MADEVVETAFLVVMKSESVGATKRDTMQADHAQRLLRAIELGVGKEPKVFLVEKVTDQAGVESMNLIEIRFKQDADGKSDTRVVEIGERP